MYSFLILIHAGVCVTMIITSFWTFWDESDKTAAIYWQSSDPTIRDKEVSGNKQIKEQVVSGQ